MQPTSYPNVNAVLHALLSGAQGVLGNHFIGMVMHGSLASGDFNPNASDLDVLVITDDELTPDRFAALQAMHAQLTASGMPWATRMEVSYIPQQALRRHDPASCHHPALRSDGTFAVDGHGSEWIIQRYIIREMGIVMAGPDPRSLIDPISPNDLRRAVIRLLHEWWEPQLADPFRLHSDEYQAYAILTMCRMFYTLEHGAIASKPVTARWAQQALGERWAALIAQAAAWQHGVALNRLGDTLDFIRYTLERSKQYAAGSSVVS
jgi:hypothetical protein